MPSQTNCSALLGIVVIPGITQLSAKDVLYRLQASKATCIITSDTLAPAVDSVASECQFLKTKLIVSKGRREGWLNLTDLYKWVWDRDTAVMMQKADLLLTSAHLQLFIVYKYSSSAKIKVLIVTVSLLVHIRVVYLTVVLLWGVSTLFFRGSLSLRKV